MIKLIFSIITLISFSNILLTSPNIDNIKVVESIDMNQDTNFTEYLMDTSLSGTKLPRNVYTYTMKQTKDTSLATWTYTNPDGYTLATLKDIAYDYEAKHPGWIVLGGVNAEGFYENELTNAFMQDGDLIRKDVSAEVFKELIGFKEDGTHIIKQQPIASDNPYLKVDDKEFEITSINKLPKNNDVSILTKDLNTTLNLEEYNVIECKYSLFRKTTKFPGGTLSGDNLGIFIKGSVLGIKEIKSINKVNNGYFYVVTKSNEVSSLLTKDKNIKCEFNYICEFSDVKMMVGYMFKLLENNVAIKPDYTMYTDNNILLNYKDHPYCTSNRQRCGIGFKEDGSIVLLTSNTNSGGPTQYEVGEMFRILGCSDAYQFDGGGSVSFIKRSEFGTLEMLNTPADGTSRKIASGVFIVTKDPGFVVDTNKTTTSKIVLKKTNKEFTNNIKDVKALINGKTYYEEKGIITIDSLNDNTKYNITISYKENDVEYNSVVTATTKKYNPYINIIAKDDGFLIKYTDTDESFTLKQANFLINNKHYILNNNQDLIITNLEKNTPYDISYTYTYINKLTNTTLSSYKESKRYYTLSYKEPYIENFSITSNTNNSITLDISYQDLEYLVSKVYILVNDDIYEISKNTTKFIVDNLYLDYLEYEISLKLNFKTPNGINNSITSNTLKIGTNSGKKPHTITYNLNGIEVNNLKDNIYEFETIELPIINKEGYKFIGWSVNGNIVTKLENIKEDIEVVLLLEKNTNTSCISGLNISIFMLTSIIVILYKKNN